MGGVDTIAVGPKDYVSFELAQKPPDAPRYYVTWQAVQSVWIPALTDPAVTLVLDDKVEFDRFARQAGLPVPELVAVHRAPGAGFQALHAQLARWAPRGVVAKPARGNKGKGVVVFASLGPAGRRGTTIRGRRRTVVSAVEQSLAAADGAVVLQELVRQHAAMDDYAPHPLSTIRVFTLLRRDGTVRLIGAFLRLGRSGAMIDNISRGGLAVDVDVETAELGDGVYELTDRVERRGTHPDAAMPFRGRRLPRWDDVVEVCTRAARALPQARFVGWDVMITGTGVVLIEGNWNVRVRTLQAARGAGLLDESLRSDLEALGVGPDH
jgi:hypothetical protein